jgi:anti-sigma B factor antagonist
MSTIRVTKASEDGVPMLALAGEFDISAVAAVQTEFVAVEEERPPRLVVDLRSLDFIDSSGLRFLLDADLRARREGRQLAIIPGPERVHRVFRVALLDKRLEFIGRPEGAQDVSHD